MMNKSLIITAISIYITFQCSFIFCTVHKTLQVFPQKSYKHGNIYPQKDILRTTEDQIEKKLDINKEAPAIHVGGTQLKKTSTQEGGTQLKKTSVPAETKIIYKSHQENDVRKDTLPRIEMKHYKTTDGQTTLQEKPEFNEPLIAKYTEQIAQWKANLDKTQSLKADKLQLEEINEKDLEREIRMWKESHNDKPTQDWKENYSQQGLPWGGSITKFTNKQENQDKISDQTENQEANQKSQFTEQDAEKEIHLWSEPNQNKEIKELKKYVDNAQEKQIEDERNAWLEQQIQAHLSSIENFGLQKAKETQKEIPMKSKYVPKEEVVANPAIEKVPEANISVDEAEELSGSEEEEYDEPGEVDDNKEESQKTLSSAEKQALQWKEILLKTNKEGQKSSKTLSVENKVRQKLAEIMSKKDENPVKSEKVEFVKAMANIANSTKLKIKELLKQQLKSVMGTSNTSLIKVDSKKTALRNNVLNLKRSNTKSPKKCIHKCFAPKCEVNCIGRRGSAACSAKGCKAKTKGPDSASLCTGEKCHADCSDELCIAACEGKECYAKCKGKTCHSVANGEAAHTECQKDDCMAY
ncbi:U3 small nucleolar ribonucleoprotein protein MPP10-like, partial [Spodoptera frugiperda]|uniref:U3 small nucleolar ribonucleoprotein protein MPP10-like n=1 Tax=Spodoptera frugiperda TaxID=7108 RepID=A0A9R0DYS1_SPOFR